jgi:hypothetical protein
MKKGMACLAVILLLAPVTAMAGMTTFLDLEDLNATEMDLVTGQTGITINMTAQITDGYVAYGDTDGVPPSAQTPGYVILSHIKTSPITIGVADKNGNGNAFGVYKNGGLMIDACTDGPTSYLVITMPETGIEKVEIGSIRLASEPGFDEGLSMGSIVIGGLVMAASTIRISGH